MLEVDDLHKRYGEIIALDGCTFNAEPGRMLGFLGPNGAGKTTTMRAIFGLLRPDSGEVRWNGSPITHADRLYFGYMPEQRGLYPKMPIDQQLIYFARLHGLDSTTSTNAANEWLERLGLGERKGDKLEQLSHGNQQRVQLAAALVHDPQVLVLDEPFSGLDPMAASTMSGVLREETAKGKIVVFSSHQLDLVEDLCEDVAIVHQGSIVLSGVVRDLKDAAPIRRLELDIDGDVDSLVSTLDGVHDSRTEEGRRVVILDATSDIRGLLSQAEQAGNIRHFIYTTPSLSDLFQEAVA